MKCALIKRDGSTGSFGNVTAARGGAYYIAMEALRLERVRQTFYYICTLYRVYNCVVFKAWKLECCGINLFYFCIYNAH